MSSADVVVVGAGLAGMTAAIALAEAGARVEVVARGHAATHWTAGGLDVAAPRGAATPGDGVDQLRAKRGHPYAVLAGDVPAAIERFQAVVAEGGLAYVGDLSSPIRAVPTAIGGTRPAAILPFAQAAALAPWTPDERLVICGFAGFKDFWPDHVASSLTRAAVWGPRADADGTRPTRVEALSVELPGLVGRRNLSALDIARAFDDPDIAAAGHRDDRDRARPHRIATRARRAACGDRPRRPRDGIPGTHRRDRPRPVRDPARPAEHPGSAPLRGAPSGPPGEGRHDRRRRAGCRGDARRSGA